jgi:nucleoid-associated protein YgaU
MLHHCEVAYGAHLVKAPESLRRELAAKEARIRELELEVVQLRDARDGRGPAIAVPRAAAKDARAKAAAAETAAPRTHTVQSGETLATISQRYYGTPARWKDIHQANRDRLPDANRVREGMELTIPE